MIHLSHKERYLKESDESLWNKFSLGDLKALEVVYDRYFYVLMRYGLSLCGSEELTEDCIQDMFTAFIARPEIPDVTYVRSYLMKTLYNGLLGKLKGDRTVDSLDEETFDMLVSDDELDALFPFDDASIEVARRLRVAYRSLKSNQQHAIYLRFIKEMSWKEMGEVLNISEHSCMNLVLRAVNKMRELLRP